MVGLSGIGQNKDAEKVFSNAITKISALFVASSLSMVAAVADAFEPFYIANVKAEGESQFMTGVRGSCSAESHIAMGAIGTDLTHHQTPFSCDAAIVTFFDRRNKHVMVTFAERATTKGVISFAGQKWMKKIIYW